MKAISRVSFMALAILLLSLSSCVKDNCEQVVTYVKATPVYMAEQNIRINITLESPRTLNNPGKIYLHQDLVFVNERNEGVHIINNADPSNPDNIAFLPIPGNIDIAASGNILYADSYMDLVAFDISNPLQPQLVKREKDVFPTGGQNEAGEYLVRYNFEEVTETVNCQEFGWQANAFTVIGQPDFENTSLNGSVVSASRANTGIAGSLSRFAITEQYLYTLQTNRITLFDISSPANPSYSNDVELEFSWNAETLFPSGDHLYIGTRNGMLIYDNTNPLQPSFLSQFWHATACDPVFVDEDYAYVTLRDGNDCNGWRNQLDVINISNPANPVQENSFNMQNPHGLSVFNDNLFLCEGNFGLKVFDTTDPVQVGNNLVQHLTGMDAFDVIAFRNATQHLLMVIGQDGLYQYNFDDPTDLKELSVIPVIK